MSTPDEKLIQEGQAVLDKMKKECEILQRELEKAQDMKNEKETDEVSRNQESSEDFKVKPRIKPTTYDGTSSWNDYLVQFEMLSETNGYVSRSQFERISAVCAW